MFWPSSSSSSPLSPSSMIHSPLGTTYTFSNPSSPLSTPPRSGPRVATLTRRTRTVSTSNHNSAFNARRGSRGFPSSSLQRPSSPSPSQNDPRFSRLLTTVLGSPFLTTSDPDFLPPDLDLVDGANTYVHRAQTITRPSSPAPTADFSIISPDDINEDVFGGSSYAYPYPYQSAPAFGFFNSPGSKRALHSSPSLGTTFTNSSPGGTPPNSLKSIFPRLWDALSSPGRNVLSLSTSSSPKNRDPFSSYSLSRSPFNSNSQSPGRKGKAKPCYEEDHSYINYSDLPPLDGEEGELIDDEACFIDVRAVTGIDILSLLPPELSLHILSLLCTPDSLPSILACLAVSRTWRRLASDNAVWRAMFLGRWGINLRRQQKQHRHKMYHNAQLTAGMGSTSKVYTSTTNKRLKEVAEEWGRRTSASYQTMKKLPPLPLSSSPSHSSHLSPSMPCTPAMIPYAPSLTRSPLTLDWRVLYRERMELDKRWAGSAGTGMRNGPEPFEPKVMRITGHSDSVYCLEFDSTRIITGSRDRTIKVWSLATGRLLGTFRGVHRGSVLCLKFERDWEEGEEGDDDSDGGCADVGGYAEGMEELSGTETVEGGGGRRGKRGFMVSGSSDCSVCVWDLYTVRGGDGRSRHSVGRAAGVEGESYHEGHERADGEAEREVVAEVRAVLKGHMGGVLDLRIDKKWIVSCSKDAVICVWDRSTLELHRTLRGHEGPVNAVGLRSGKVVSASGDGKMILWDIESGERLRTFEGHDRGLACIEFKDDLIVSGSNDCKIKVWSASTGECLRTLVGHEALVRALSFDPRSGRLVSASYDKTVKLWDLRSGKMVRQFQSSHTSHIFDVKFDVARVVSTSHDHKIVVLDFSHGLDTSLFV